jgi:hypothetical protein
VGSTPLSQQFERNQGLVHLRPSGAHTLAAQVLERQPRQASTDERLKAERDEERIR